MIEVHRLNGELFLLNSDMIETVEVTPDTVIRLINGHRYVIRETFKDVQDAVIEFRRRAGYVCFPVGNLTEQEHPHS